jgi:large conductance mechanosensitive channel
MLREFMDFIRRGNVLDLAVAVILGVAFGAIVTSLVDDIIMPLIGLLLGGIDFSSLSFQVGDAVVAYGNFIQAVINFLLIALAVFFIVRIAKSMQRPPAPAVVEPTPEEILLREIRDLLAADLNRRM